MFNIVSLMFLFFFIFAVLANFLLKDILTGTIINNDTVNFKNFGNSFIMMFRMSTGEDWDYIMYDTMVFNNNNCIYFIAYVIVI